MGSREENGPFNIFAEANIIIEFFDLDPMQVVWHGNYINYFEIGRRSLLEKIGYSYFEMEQSGFAFPVVEITAKYIGPLRFRDRARIKAILMEYENCLRIRYEIINIETGALCTRGLSTQMAYDMKAGESCFACPEKLINKVKALRDNAPADKSILERP